MSLPVSTSNIPTTSGLSTMPRSNFTPAATVATYRPSQKWSQFPRNSLRNVREKHATPTALSSVADNGQQRKSDAALFPVHLKEFESTAWEKFEGLSLKTKGVLVPLQLSLGNINWVFKNAQQDKKAFQEARDELAQKRTESSAPLDAAYVLLTLLTEAKDIQTLCQALVEHGFDPNDPRLKADKEEGQVEAKHKTIRPKNPGVAQRERAADSQAAKTSASKRPAKSGEAKAKASVAKASAQQSPVKAATKALVKEIQTQAVRLAQLQAPTIDIEGIAKHHASLRKVRMLQALNFEFGDHLPVLDVQVDAEGRLARIKVKRAGLLGGRKWIDIAWAGNQPQFRDRPNRFPGEWDRAKLNKKWANFSATLQKYDAASTVNGAPAKPALRLQRLVQAWEHACGLLQYAKPPAPNAYLREDLQNMKYEIADRAKFRKAYESADLNHYFKGMNDADKGEHIAALLVESSKDCFEMMAGHVSVEQIVELVRLFPQNLAAADKGDAASVEDKEAIREKLREVLGEAYQFVGSIFRLHASFCELLAAQLQTPSLKAFAKNCYEPYLRLFGFSGEQWAGISIGLGEQEHRVMCKKLPMFAYHLAKNAADFFPEAG